MVTTSHPSVLFVCLGNICRSPMAEAAFRAEAERAGLSAFADSAGTSDWHIGHAPDPRAQAVTKEHGVDISQYQARQIAAEDYMRFTRILALDEENLASIRQGAPAGATAQISLLLDYVPGREGEAVVDPYFGEDDGFQITWSDVTAAARGLVKEFGS